MARRVLVVDDEPGIRELLRFFLESGGFEVRTASNGTEGLAAYGEDAPPIVLLDGSMPDMTGYQVLEALQHEDLNTFVIVVSADVQPMAQQRVRSLGAAAFIAKPVTPEAVLPILKEYGLYV